MTVEPFLQAVYPPPHLWDVPDPVEIAWIEDKATWARLRQFVSCVPNVAWGAFAGVGALSGTPLGACFDIAEKAGASTAVVETRYMDMDYRSEYSNFYSQSFASLPDSARRIHFFRARLTPAQITRLPANPGYLGYVVVRPSRLGPVCRAILRPPDDQIQKALRVHITADVTFFGQSLHVTGVPFSQQDTQVGRCAHASAWMCHYAASCRQLVARRPTAHFHMFANPGLGVGRPFPSAGLTIDQLHELLRVFGLPPLVYDLEDIRELPRLDWLPRDPVAPRPQTEHDPAGYWDARVVPVLCRYLNSRLPVIIATDDHAFTLVGYERTPTRRGRPDKITFYRNDDQVGPYRRIDNMFDDRVVGGVYSPWRHVIVPLPEKLWLTAEDAEFRGGQMLVRTAEALSERFPTTAVLQQLRQRRRLGLRTYAIPSNTYRQQMDARRIDPAVAVAYRWARFSRFIWVVEAIDCDKRDSDRREGRAEQCVLGEVILDATSSGRQPVVLAMHVPGIYQVPTMEPVAEHSIFECDPRPYETGRIFPPFN